MRSSVFGLILCILSSAAYAGESDHTENYQGEHLSVAAGYFDMLHNEGAAQFNLEYRSHDIWNGIRPVIGVSLTTDGSFYGYGGANWDIYLSDSWILSPNFMIGGYTDGGGKDLGHALEFRSGLEVDYEFANDSRLGVTFNHISNASIGDKNPGAESLMLIYSHPIYAW